MFNPSSLDAGQWASTFKEAGFKGVILTCKHHDGFCLWPTQLSEHSVKSSPWQSGAGDVVKSLAEACRRHGLKFGIYVSPWDRNHRDYGTPAYLDYYRGQLDELFKSYGPLFEMWFDGANGGDGYYGGAREKRAINGSTYYEWPVTLNGVRELSPSIIFFSDAGPGVRWVGNEKGIAGETNWCTITPDTLFAGKAGIESILNTGSENGTAWIPAETDVSIRPGWFYHAREDSLVKSPDQLFKIYLTSVGRGSTLLLNVPPDRRGLIHENDVASLKGFRKLLDSVFRHNQAREASIEVESYRGKSKEYAGANLIDSDVTTSWATDDDMLASTIELGWNEEREFSFLVLQETISLGQRVKAFRVDSWEDGQWKIAGEGTTIGYKRIVPLSLGRTTRLRISITESRACPVLHTIGVY